MKYLLSLMTLTFSLIAFAQTDSISSNPTDSIASKKQNTEILEDVRLLLLKDQYANRYKMYRTENVYNLLKLDTQTGRIEQVQWSLDNNKEFISTINSTDLSWENGLNSFELYPTQNMYQFILLDKATGRTWHVQWGLESKKRWIQRIY